MCIVAAVRFHGGALLCTDTRIGYLFKDGRAPLYRDPGAKLWRCAGGWMSGTGDGALLAAVLPHLSKARSVAEAQRVVAAVYADQRAHIEETYPEHRLRTTRFFYIPDQATTGGLRAITVFGPNGARLPGASMDPTHTDKGQESDYTLSFPPELTGAEEAELESALVARLEAATDVGHMVRALAALVRDTAAKAPSVSAVAEVALAHDQLVHERGTSRGLYQRPAAELAQMSTPDIVAAFRGAHPPPQAFMPTQGPSLPDCCRTQPGRGSST